MIENIIKDYGLFIIIAETVLVIALLLWRLSSDDDSTDEIDELKQDKKGLEKQLVEKNKLLYDYTRALNEANSKLKQWSDWYEQNKHLLERQEQKSNVIEFDLSQDNKHQVNTSQVLYQYLQEANDGKFMRILPSPEKCYFRTWEDDGVRKYEFCGNVAKALANINAIFDDVCEIEGKRRGATEIENVAAGTLDSELRITSKAKIRLK
ncbi:MAG: hypothetical protein KBT33_01795 [Prevotellaceae bacterium]|nr:hypothetical protein [Candidatus Minthosoma equi]